MRYRTRAFLICFVPFAVLLAASFWLAQQLVQRTVRESLLASLRASQLSMARAQAKADLENARFLEIAGEDAALKSGMQLLRTESDSQQALTSMEERLRELGTQMGFDFLSVSAPDGEPLAVVVRQGGNRTGKSQLAPFDGPIPELGAKGLLVFGNRTFQYASVPIREGDESIGTLAVGEYFDYPGSASPAVLVSKGETIYDNIPGVPEDAMTAVMHGCESKWECDFQLRGVRWIAVPVQDLGAGYVLWSLENVDAATAPVRSRLRNLFLIMALGSVLVALLCSMVSARSIVKPIALVVSHLRNAESTGVLPQFTVDLSSTREIGELVESYNRAAASVKNARGNLQGAYVEFAGSLANALDARDRYTAGHSRRVSRLSCATAAAMGLGPEHIEQIRVGALLHDIGKIGIADALLQKPGRLTEREFALIKEHPVIGRRILEGVQGLTPYIEAVELHHENWDGSGYPKGQSGEETPIDARIIHVSDAYDAMTTDRSYRFGMSHERAIDILQTFAGTQFDPWIVERFVDLPVEIVTGNHPYGLVDRIPALEVAAMAAAECAFFEADLLPRSGQVTA